MTAAHQCAGGFFCRECGGMFCEHCACECFACRCPCHGTAVVIHADDASQPGENPRR